MLQGSLRSYEKRPTERLISTDELVEDLDMHLELRSVESSASASVASESPVNLNSNIGRAILPSSKAFCDDLPLGHQS